MPRFRSAFYHCFLFVKRVEECNQRVSREHWVRLRFGVGLKAHGFLQGVLEFRLMVQGEEVLGGVLGRECVLGEVSWLGALPSLRQSYLCLKSLNLSEKLSMPNINNAE